jgi:hypothetical protein
MGELDFGTMTAREFILYQSQLSAGRIEVHEAATISAEATGVVQRLGGRAGTPGAPSN